MSAGPWERAPCGCAWRITGVAFIMWPCQPGCRVWRYAQALASRTGRRFAGVVVDPARAR